MIECELCRNFGVQIAAHRHVEVEQTGDIPGLLFDGDVCQYHTKELAASVGWDVANGLPRHITIRKVGEW